MFSRLKYLYLAYLSKPVGDRTLYRTIGKTGARKILEIGLGPTARTLRMLDLAARRSGGEATRLAAIDLFEARASEQPGLSLKEAHRVFKGAANQVQLIPGDPAATLPRVANSLAKIDLIIISSLVSDEALSGAWYYLPRMLNATSVVLRESAAADGQTGFSPIPHAEIESRAGAARRRAA